VQRILRKVNTAMEQKYTAAQYAQMSGGHTLESPAPSQYEFIKNLNESKLFRTRQQADTADARHVTDFAFLNTITLWVLYNNYSTAPIAKSYAANTVAYYNFNSYRQSGTDLYVALNRIKNGTGIDDKSNLLYSRSSFNEIKMRQFLNDIAQGKNYYNARSFFLQLEKNLNIENSVYKSIRRLAADFKDLSQGEKALVVTRLLQYYRTNAIRSELYEPLKAMAREKGLELKNVDNGEKKGLSTLTKFAVGTAAGFALGRAFGRSII
jgi:hypothetical protein